MIYKNGTYTGILTESFYNGTDFKAGSVELSDP